MNRLVNDFKHSRNKNSFSFPQNFYLFKRNYVEFRLVYNFEKSNYFQLLNAVTTVYFEICLVLCLV